MNEQNESIRRAEFETKFKAWWESLNRKQRRDFIKRARRGVDKKVLTKTS